MTYPTVVRRDVRSADSAGRHTCVALTTGEVECWGNNACGASGAPRPGRAAITRVPIQEVQQVTTGIFFSCARTRSGEVHCWGRVSATSGQAGANCRISHRPRHVPGLTDVVDIAAGDDHVCALSSSGEVHCWGRNRFGQLGDGSGVELSDQPVRVLLEAGVDLEADGDATCLRHQEGTITCWGYAFVPWRFTDAPAMDRPEGSASHEYFGRLTPTQVPEIRDARDIMVGDGYACALLPNDRVTCFGSRIRSAQRSGGSPGPLEENPHFFHEAPSLLW